MPLGAEISLEILASKYKTISLTALGLNNMIAPVQEGQPKCGDPVAPSAPDAQVYAGGYYPLEQLAIINDFIVRGHRIVVLEIRPVRYNATAAELETTSEMTLRLNLQGSDMALTYSEADRLNYGPPIAACKTRC